MTTWTIRACTTKELAALYQVSEKVIRTWIKPFKNEIGPRSGYYWTVKQVEIIIKNLGSPPGADVIFTSSAA